MKTLRAQLRQYRYLTLVLVAVVIALLFFIAQNQVGMLTLPDLVTTKAEIRDVKRKVSVDGNLAGLKERSVAFPTQSKVKKLNYKEGQKVKKNAVLAKVAVTTVLGQKQIQQIKSPIKGTVTAVNYEVGDLVVDFTLPGFHISDASSYKIELEVNENDVIDLKKGQSASLVFPAISLDKEYSGIVASVALLPISVSGAINYLTVVKPKKVPKGVKLGMSVDVVITTATANNVLSIPESFLLEKDDKLLVKLIAWENPEHTAYNIVEREVEIGLRTDEFVEIKNGITEEDELVEPSFVQERNSFGFFG